MLLKIDRTVFFISMLMFSLGTAHASNSDLIKIEYWGSKTEHVDFEVPKKWVDKNWRCESGSIPGKLCIVRNYEAVDWTETICDETCIEVQVYISKHSSPKSPKELAQVMKASVGAEKNYRGYPCTIQLSEVKSFIGMDEGFVYACDFKDRTPEYLKGSSMLEFVGYRSDRFSAGFIFNEYQPVSTPPSLNASAPNVTVYDSFPYGSWKHKSEIENVINSAVFKRKDNSPAKAAIKSQKK